MPSYLVAVTSIYSNNKINSISCGILVRLEVQKKNVALTNSGSDRVGGGRAQLFDPFHWFRNDAMIILLGILIERWTAGFEE